MSTTSFAQLDTSFNNTGFQTDVFAGGGGRVYVTLLQPDGKIVVAGGAGGSFDILRFNHDGTRYTSFDGDGRVTTPVGGNLGAQSLLLQPDGKIIAGGQQLAGTYRSVLLRYNSDGSLDNSFGTAGKVLTEIAPLGSSFNATAIQPDGKILAVGWAYNGSNSDIGVVRYNIDGSIDTSFNGGKISTSVSGSSNEIGRSVGIQPDGKIVVEGTKTESGISDSMVFVRYNPDGTLDGSFGNGGIAATSVIVNPPNAFASIGMALPSDGKIVTAHRVVNSETNVGEFVVFRFNSDGTADTSFGIGGRSLAAFPLATEATPARLRVRPDGRILVGGMVVFQTWNMAFAQFDPDGSLDRSFDLDGRAAIKIPGYDEANVADFAFDAQGHIVAVGTSNNRALVAKIKTGDVEDVVNPTLLDFSGDRRADLTIIRPSNWTWYTQSADSFSFRAFGETGDTITPADFDGDGITDIAVYRNTGVWYYIGSATQTFHVVGWGGQLGDRLVPSDLSGDGKADFVIYRQLDRKCHVRTTDYVDSAISYGVAGDRPERGDFDNDGVPDIAIYRPSDHTWRVTNSSRGTSVRTWGENGDIRVAADYDGDGATDIAVWRPSTGQWWIIGSSWGWMTWNIWGEPDDVPVPADYDGDGRADVAVFRPSNSTWYIVNSSDNSIYIRQFGESGDGAVPAAFRY